KKSVLKVLYGRAFLAPSTWELDVAERIGTSLKPELNNSLELVYDYIVTPKVSFSLSLFYMRISDYRIIYDAATNEDIRAYNSDNVQKTKGFELQCKFILPHNISVWLGTSYADAKKKDEASGTTSSLYALSKVLGYGKIRIPVFKKTIWTVSGKYVSATENLLGEEIPSWFCVDTALYWPNVCKGLGFRIKVGNVFNSEYYAAPRDVIVSKIPYSKTNAYISLIFKAK
ncbi:MAG: TonB-dependent receptor, partial [bacterium]|nr:TonB-dependent receptor [bacterium]